MKTLLDAHHSSFIISCPCCYVAVVSARAKFDQQVLCPGRLLRLAKDLLLIICIFQWIKFLLKATPVRFFCCTCMCIHVCAYGSNDWEAVRGNSFSALLYKQIVMSAKCWEVTSWFWLFLAWQTLWGFSGYFSSSENQNHLLGCYPGNTLNIFSQYNSMPFKSISRDILGLKAVDELISSNISNSVKLL